MAQVIEVFAMKGGVGTSTTALSIAHQASNSGLKVLLVDNAGSHDILALAGMSASCMTQDNMTVEVLGRGAKMHQYSDEYDLVVVDCGSNPTDIFDDEAERVLVVRNEYLALRNSASIKKDRVVCLFQEGNALIHSDIKNVVSAPVTFVPINTAVSRAIDAGMFFSREIVHEWAKDFVSTKTTVA